MPTSKELKDLDSQLKKTVISAESFKRGSSLDSSKSIANIHKTIGNLAGHTRKLAVRFIDLEKVVENNSKKITSLKNLSQSQGKRISGENIGAKLPGGTTSNVEGSISAIAKSVNSIAEILAGRKKLADDTAVYERRKAEQEKRGLAESKLETVFSGIAKTAEKIIAPVKSILDRILEFIGTVILGRIVFKIIEWFGKKENQEKVQSLIRFFKDHWPKLLALYLVFGNSFGRFVFSLTKTLIGGAVKLGIAIAKLLAAKKVAGAKGAAKFLGRAGKPIAAGLAVAATVGSALAVSNTLKGDEQPKTQKFSGGGLAIPKFSGGGFNFKGMLGGAGMGAMFGPLGMLLGGAFGSGKPQQMMSGFVSGEKGVDKVPAMLSDGEFVMSRGAVAKYGVGTLEAMNAAGGGTNKPKIMSGTAFAQGGGYITTKEEKKEKVKDPILEKRQKELDKLSNAASFGNYSDVEMDANKSVLIDKRLKRIESQMQVQRALASGKGISVKGATFGTDIGTGYGAKYKGRDAIKVKLPPGGSYEPQITLAGKIYYAMKQGDNIVYTAQDSRDVGGGGIFKPGGMFGGPRMSARQNYAASKGKYYDPRDRKTYASKNDADSAYKSRMTNLASQQRLIKLSGQGGTGGRSGIRYDTEMEAFQNEQEKRGGIIGQLSRWSQRAFGGNEARERLDAEHKASQARIKQKGAESIGRYYSSSDGKYYKDYAAAKKARDLRLAQQQKRSAPGITPSPKPQQQTYSQRMKARQDARRGVAGGAPKTPNFGATNPAASSAKSKTLGVKG
jgi:hypothetical protein